MGQNGCTESPQDLSEILLGRIMDPCVWSKETFQTLSHKARGDWLRCTGPVSRGQHVWRDLSATGIRLPNDPLPPHGPAEVEYRCEIVRESKRRVFRSRYNVGKEILKGTHYFSVRGADFYISCHTPSDRSVYPSDLRRGPAKNGNRLLRFISRRRGLT